MVDRTVRVRVEADLRTYKRELTEGSAVTTGFAQSVDSTGRPLADMEKNADGAGREIDKLSGRLRLAADAAVVFGPALTPLGAAAVGGVVALSAQVGALAGGLGVTLLAVNGLADGWKALNEYQLERTPENLAKVREEFAKLGPDAEHFVRYLDSIEGDLRSLQMAARDGALPGFEEGIDGALDRLTELRTLIFRMSTEVGDLAADAGDAIGGDRFDAFFEYLDTDGIRILDDTARTMGNLAVAGANVIEAFAPLELDFSGGLLDWSRNLAEASANLDSNDGAQRFMAYIRTEGPEVLDMLGSFGSALLAIVEATAPIGGPVVDTLTAVADIIGVIADSDLGTPILAGMAALALYNRVLSINVALQKQAAMGNATFTSTVVSGAQNQVNSLKAIPGAFREITVAQRELETAQSAQAAARGKYIGQLQVQNRMQAQGFSVSRTGQDRLADSLGRLEMANYGVMTATERVSAAERERRALTRGVAGDAAKGAAALGGMAIASSDFGQASGLSNTAMLGTMGLMAGPWGAAVGAGVGLLLDLSSANGKAAESTALLDQNLQANAGNLEAQWAAIRAAREEAKAMQDDLDSDSFGEFFKNAVDPDVLVAFTRDAFGQDTGADQFSAATEKKAEALGEASRASTQYMDAAMGVAAAEERQAAATEQAINAMRAKRQEALQGLNAELDYKSAIRDANDAIKENGKTVDGNTDAGEANLRALYNLAGAWNAQSDAAKNARGSLRSARDNFLETADAMGMPIKQAERLAARLFEIPPKRKTEIDMNVSPALQAIQIIKGALKGIDDEDVNIRIHRIGSTADINSGGIASGGTVPGPRHPYGDRDLYRLAPGEEVISNRHGQADRHRGMLKKINAGLADGGTSGDYRRSGGTQWALPGTAAFDAAAAGAAIGLKGLKKALEAAQRSLEKEKSKRDELVAQRDSFASSVGGAYSGADPFAGGLSDFDTGVSANTNDSNAAKAALRAAAGKGLDGPLYQALAASGNLTLLQEFAGLSAAQIKQREKSFGSQSAAQAGLGSSAAAAAGLTAAVTAQNKVIDKLEHTIKNLEAAVERGAHKGSESGTRKGNSDKDWSVATEIRTGVR